MLTHTPAWPLAIHLFTGTFCLGCSAAFHLLQIKSQKVQEVMSRLDDGGLGAHQAREEVLKRGLDPREALHLRALVPKRRRRLTAAGAARAPGAAGARRHLQRVGP